MPKAVPENEKQYNTKPASDCRHAASAQEPGTEGDGWARLVFQKGAGSDLRFHGSYESVPTLRQRLNEPWVLGVVAQGFANSIDGFVESSVEVADRVRGPKPLLEFFPGHHFARALDQCGQSLKGLLLQPDLQTPFAQLARTWIHFEVLKANWLPSDTQ
jgi:hypothetical protein